MSDEIMQLRASLEAAARQRDEAVARLTQQLEAARAQIRARDRKMDLLMRNSVMWLMAIIKACGYRKVIVQDTNSLHKMLETEKLVRSRDGKETTFEIKPK
jgi:hypothetical protein